jgi:hypothetical protein
MKLTKAQEDILRLTANGSFSCARYYRPATRLVERGLCEWDTGNLGSTWLTITEAGRAALKEMGE